MTDLSNVKALAWDIGGTTLRLASHDQGRGLSDSRRAQGVELDAAAFTNMWRFTMFKRLQLVPSRVICRGSMPTSCIAACWTR